MVDGCHKLYAACVARHRARAQRMRVPHAAQGSGAYRRTPKYYMLDKRMGYVAYDISIILYAWRPGGTWEGSDPEWPWHPRRSPSRASSPHLSA
eukprot:3815419-Pleurochrysis_carterae.AAC.3